MMESMTTKGEEHKVFKVGVISGKGGVGKTTVTGSLALLFKEHNRKIIGADCDVDAPNLGLIFKGGQKIDTVQIKTTEKAHLDVEKCISCKECVDEHYCNFHAISWDEVNNRPKLDDLACEGCGACYELCPEGAYSINAINSGYITYEKSNYGFPLIWGETTLGATTSGKLVTEIKKYIMKVAKKEELNLILIDGPPGIGCPVVATVSDLDYVIVVMEPTATALHDAMRAIEVLTQLNRDFGVVINKADAWEKGNNEIKKYSKQYKFDIIGEIPVDQAIPNATVKGIPVYDYDPDAEASNALKSIYQYLVDEIIPENFLKS